MSVAPPCKTSAAVRRRVLEVFSTAVPPGKHLDLKQLREELSTLSSATLLGAANDLLDAGALELANPERRRTHPKLLKRGERFDEVLHELGEAGRATSTTDIVERARRQRSAIEAAWWPHLGERRA